MLTNTSGGSSSWSEGPRSLSVVLSLHLDTGKVENCNCIGFVLMETDPGVLYGNTMLPAMPQNKIGLSAVFSWT